ncbi:MAG: NUDIX hydrolase [bacterium]|nr:NUDIX hydrolase [bacterium]
MSVIKKMRGLPIMDLQNFSKLLRTRNIAGFRRLGKKLPLERYLTTKLTEREKSELRFAPKTEIVKFKDPNGNIFTGFRNAQKDGVLVFALLPNNLLPICAEFRHGCERVMLTLPGGLIEPSDKNPEATAKREFAEEMGIALKKLIPLNTRGIPVDARSSTRKNFFFLGIPAIPIKSRRQKTDKAEFVARFLISIEHWLALMERGLVDESAVATSLLALKKLRSL